MVCSNSGKTLGPVRCMQPKRSLANDSGPGVRNERQPRNKSQFALIRTDGGGTCGSLFGSRGFLGRGDGHGMAHRTGPIAIKRKRKVQPHASYGASTSPVKIAASLDCIRERTRSEKQNDGLLLRAETSDPACQKAAVATNLPEFSRKRRQPVA